MTSKIFKLLVPLLFISFLSFAQQTFKISGRVKSSDGAVEAATINIVEERRNIMTDSLGYYDVELKAGNYTFLISAVGMNSLRKSVKVNKNHIVDFDL